MQRVTVASQVQRDSKCRVRCNLDKYAKPHRCQAQDSGNLKGRQNAGNGVPDVSHIVMMGQGRAHCAGVLGDRAPWEPRITTGQRKRDRERERVEPQRNGKRLLGSLGAI